MQRKKILYLLAVVALLVSMLPLSAVAQEASSTPLQIEEFAASDDKTLDGAGAAGSFLPMAAPDGMAFFNETEPNDTAATANALPGSQAVVLGNVSPAGDYDYFSFTANAGDRVYAAVQTQWSNASGDSRLDVMDSDGVTSLEFDDDNGVFSGLASVIGGTIIPTTGTYYVRVYGYSATTTVITPYHLHVRVQSGSPTAEVEPNNDLATANPLAASQWMSGTITAIADPDLFYFTLNAGDSVFLGLDMDPGRLASNTNWNGRLGLGLFNNTILVANETSTTKPHAEAMFMTVQQAGTYYAYVDSVVATGLGPNARYHLSVSIYPKAVQNNCTTFISTDVPKVIGPGVGTTTSTITVPGTVTSSITDINATIVLTHTNMPDLDVTLVGPTAANTALFTDVGATAQTQMNVGMDDQAALPIGPFTVVSGMINQPEQPGRLATFNGTPAGGTWTLQLADDLASNGGRLQSWSLEICGDPPPAYGIELVKTVGIVPAVCAATDTVTIPPGADVYYCYTVRNTGLNAVDVHDLVDSELGTIFTGMNHVLAPGATYSHIEQATVYSTVTNTGTWTAHSGANSASDSDTATVNVRAMTCPVGYNPVTVDFTFFDNPFPPAGWSVTNTSTGACALGVPQWTNTNPGSRANLTGGVGPFAIGDSDRCGSGSVMDTMMTTGLLDFTGLISPTLSYNTDYYDLSATAGATANLGISLDGGGTWNNLLTWNGSHRGPLLVTQALTGAAGENDVQVRWHYAQAAWDYWWQVDNAFITACEPVPANPVITLDKTVGTDPLVCAATDQITVPAGTDVTYCYEVTNTGNVEFNTHTLVDSELGTLLSNFPYVLSAGASAFITETTTINATTVNTATWTAYNQQGPSVTATDVATVTVQSANPAITLDKTVGTDPTVCATGDAITVAAGTDVTYCYEVTNTGDVTLNLHDLVDSELGSILSSFPYTLAPGASAFLTETATINVTTVNTATWTAYNQADVQVCSTPNVAIPDNNPTGVSDTLDSTTGGTISDLDVYIDTTHTWVGDLIYTLQHVDTGTTVTLIDRPGRTTTGFGCNGNDIDNTVDDEATLSFENNCTSGSNPTQAFVAGQAYLGGDPASNTLLSAFDGEDLSGDWTMTVSDNSGGDTGTLHEWCLVASGAPVSVQASDVATVTVQTAGGPEIELTKTVGVVPAVCAVTDNITITAGTQVYYCYQVENTGTVALNYHDLVDSELGVLANDLPYALGPGATHEIIVPETPMVSVTNTATWTAMTALGAYVYDDTVAFNYIPINATGTPLGLADDGEANITLPFSFTFYGVSSSNLRVGNNGGILFNATTGEVGFSNVALPNAGHPLAIFPFWDDLDSDTGDVYWEVQGTAPNRMAIIEWYNRPHFSNTGAATFEVILYEGSNEIKFQYLDTDFGNPAYDFGVTATSGLNKDGTTALQYSYNQAVLTNNKAILFYEVIPQSATDSDSATVTVQTPNIDVSPLSLTETHLTPPQTTNQTLTVANTGLGTLTWNIVEEPVLVRPARLTGGDASVAADVADAAPFKAPEQTTAPAPLSDWRAPEVVLYDNGPLVTHPGGGAGGADASALQTALGLTTYGAGNQAAAGNRVADDFTVTGGGWFINTMTFFGYQTGSGTTSTFTALNLRIWDGPPNLGSSNVVFGDTTTNRLASSTWANMYRVLDTGLLDTARPVMANVATVNTFLPAGTYWVDWQADGSLASGPWAPPISILGQTTTGNAWQFTSTGWAALMDGAFPQGLPFIVDGLADCSNPADVPWLSVSPTSGSNAGGSSTPVTVGFDSTSLANGTYTARLCVFSNDPNTGPGNETSLVIVPVTLIVGDPTAVTLDGLSAAPLPVAGLPVAALPAAIGLALGAVYALRRRKD